MRCLAKDPRKRFGSAEDLEEALLAAPLGGMFTAPLVLVGGDADTRPVVPWGTGPPRCLRSRVHPAGRGGRGTEGSRRGGWRSPAWWRSSGSRRSPSRRRTTSCVPAGRARAGRSVSEQVPESTPPSVADAWTDLIDEIASGAASGRDRRGRSKLADKAVKILEAYGGATTRASPSTRRARGRARQGRRRREDLNRRGRRPQPGHARAPDGVPGGGRARRLRRRRPRRPSSMRGTKTTGTARVRARPSTRTTTRTRTNRSGRGLTGPERSDEDRIDHDPRTRSVRSRRAAGRDRDHPRPSLEAHQAPPLTAARVRRARRHHRRGRRDRAVLDRQGRLRAVRRASATAPKRVEANTPASASRSRGRGRLVRRSAGPTASRHPAGDERDRLPASRPSRRPSRARGSWRWSRTARSTRRRRQHLPAVRGPHPVRADARHHAALLTHTSGSAIAGTCGAPPGPNPPCTSKDSPISLGDFVVRTSSRVRSGTGDARTSSTGHLHRYAYSFLDRAGGFVAESASGIDFNELCKERILLASG